MFATVEFYDGGSGFTDRLRHFFGRDKLLVRKVRLDEDECFYRIGVPVFEGETDLRRLREIDFSLGEGLIFPSGTQSETDGLQLYRVGYFPSLVLLNSVVSVLSEEAQAGSGMKITLIDERACLTNEIHRLVPFASEIRVITDRPLRYKAASEKLMKDYGLSLITGSQTKEIPTDKGVLISYDPMKVPLSFRGVLFTAKERLLPFARVMTAQGLKNTLGYEGLCPKGIDRMVFLSALYEVSFQKRLHFAEFEGFCDTGVQKI